jgi:hypothetical protein
MVSVDVGKLSKTLTNAGIPEKRALLLARAFNDSINEIDPVSQSYVMRRIEKSKNEILQYLVAFLGLQIILIPCFHYIMEKI